jgi:hypothetical protein
MPIYRTHSGTCDQILLSVRRCFSESCCLVCVGRPLWLEDGSVIYSYNCFWALPVQSLSDSRSAEVTISYCPIWDSSKLEVEVEVTLQLTVSQSVSMSRYRAHSGTCDQILLSVLRLFSEVCCLVSVGRPLWREVGSVICLSQSSNLPVFTSNIYVTCVLQFSNLYTIYIYIYKDSFSLFRVQQIMLYQLLLAQLPQ